jgi:hypothetical protein
MDYNKKPYKILSESHWINGSFVGNHSDIVKLQVILENDKYFVVTEDLGGYIDKLKEFNTFEAAEKYLNDIIEAFDEYERKHPFRKKRTSKVKPKRKICRCK